MSRLQLLLLLTAMFIDLSLAFLARMSRPHTFHSGLQHSLPASNDLSARDRAAIEWGELTHGTAHAPSSGVQLTAYQILHP
jgi:hypothetical protein